MIRRLLFVLNTAEDQKNITTNNAKKSKLVVVKIRKILLKQINAKIVKWLKVQK